MGTVRPIIFGHEGMITILAILLIGSSGGVMRGEMKRETKDQDMGRGLIIVMAIFPSMQECGEAITYSSPPRLAAASEEQFIGALSDIGVMEEDGGGEDLLLEDDLFDEELMDIEEKTQEMEITAPHRSKGLLPPLIRGGGAKEEHDALTVVLGG
ncbi:unnamed protein product [Eruca vesicaria subsp. sativa]|uniref:Uncharacterized protein n=1 Tax=Eruca vesicaria subsp. sativa TaxID=29727 RepID=A0ABC8M281_ERUVS|nr:unnamed protein product [Eruca vesicaria subsp. sativa]